MKMSSFLFVIDGRCFPNKKEFALANSRAERVLP
jgi:hypothetical protein